MAIPQRGNAACFALARQRITGGGDNRARISTNEQIGAFGDGVASIASGEFAVRRR